MGKTVLVVLIVLILGGAGYFFYRSQYSTNSMMTASQTPSVASVPANSVIIQGNAFTPATISAKVGDTITWTNNDSYAHTVTSDTGVFDSSTLDAGKSFTYTFAKAGTFPYHCAIHTFMTAQVVVTN